MKALASTKGKEAEQKRVKVFRKEGRKEGKAARRGSFMGGFWATEKPCPCAGHQSCAPYTVDKPSYSPTWKRKAEPSSVAGHYPSTDGYQPATYQYLQRDVHILLPSVGPAKVGLEPEPSHIGLAGKAYSYSALGQCLQ